MSAAFDTIIAGGNFCGMAAAFDLQRRGEQVLIMEAGKRFGGFMKPLEHGPYQLDKGPQFFENFNERDRRFMDALLDDDMLEDIGFSYSSYGHGELTDGFAVPDWRRLGPERAQAVFFDLLQLRLTEDFEGRWAGARDFREICSLDGGTLLAPTLEALCAKILQAEPESLAPQAYTVATFLGRKLLFDQGVSAALKAAPVLDDLLAARKHSFGETVYNLYPRGRNLEAVRACMEARMHALGVTCEVDQEVAAVERTADGVTVRTSTGATHEGSRLLAATDIRQSETMLLGSTTLQDESHLLPEIFYFFVVDQEKVHPSYYMQDYDLEHRVARITNMANYMGSAAGEGRGVICAEVPARKDDDYWAEPARHVDSVWSELGAVGAADGAYHEAWAVPVPVTYKMGKVGYPAALKSVLASVTERFGDSVLVPEPNRLTRQQTLDALRALDVIQDGGG